MSLLEVEHLVKWFPVAKGFGMKKPGYLKAVDDVSLSINKGETLGLVGETGCGKTTLARSIIRLEQPTSGKVVFDGIEITALSVDQLRKVRPRMQVVFQDPYSSLNPRLTVRQIVGEAVEFHGMARGRECDDLVSDLLNRVGLDPSAGDRHPHEFSGGQRQRIGIARALALKPKMVVCDEPVSALDVSVQSQILNLLKELQDDFGMTYLFIAHGLGVVKHVSDRVGVMYLGKLVETASSDDLYGSPLHPYTQALISAIPVSNPRERKDRIVLEGDVPSPVNPPPGCRFHTRCPRAAEVCRHEEPELIEVAAGHCVACHKV